MSEKKGGDNNLISLPGGGNADLFAEAVRNLKKNMATHMEYIAIDAKIKRATYVALIEEGFTAEQALTIVKEK